MVWDDANCTVQYMYVQITIVCVIRRVTKSNNIPHISDCVIMDMMPLENSRITLFCTFLLAGSNTIYNKKNNKKESNEWNSLSPPWLSFRLLLFFFSLVVASTLQLIVWSLLMNDWIDRKEKKPDVVQHEQLWTCIVMNLFTFYKKCLLAIFCTFPRVNTNVTERDLRFFS